MGGRVQKSVRFRVRGRVAAGMFSHERVFSVEGADGFTLEVIVPAADVDEREGAATVPAVVMERSNDHSLVIVPGQPLETGQTVWIPDRELISA